MEPDPPAAVAGLLAFISASPSPFHAVAELARRLTANGWQEIALTAPDLHPTRAGFVQRGGALVAWGAAQPGTPFRIIGAHSDSPNLRIVPRPDRALAELSQLGIEPYGGLLRNSWLDRDLGLSGRIATRAGIRLFHDNRPLLRVPQLAIHLDRMVNEGLVLDPERHLTPVWGGSATAPRFVEYLGERCGVSPEDILGWEAMCHDVTPPAVLGVDASLITAPRLDNLASCFAGLEALLAVGRPALADGSVRPVLAVFDHEEVGSESATGAAGPLLEQVLVELAGTTRRATFAASGCLSADMAHAVHPNYPERHDPTHPVTIGGGPVLKSNVNQRYATDASGAAEFQTACEIAEVPLQTYHHRNDLPCGSTIGPITATRLGIRTTDVGTPLLSMHSIRELTSVADIDGYRRALTVWLSGTPSAAAST
jgi:aspartyl aminopeptidase